MDLQRVDAVSMSFLRLATLGALALVLVMLALAPPGVKRRTAPARAATVAEVEAVAAVVAMSDFEQALRDRFGEWRQPEIVEWPVDAPEIVPRAIATLNVHLGPNENYVILGLVPKGGRLDVIGRDPSGAWLAVVFSPGSKLTGWVPRARVTGMTTFDQLQVVPVTFIQQR